MRVTLLASLDCIQRMHEKIPRGSTNTSSNHGLQTISNLPVEQKLQISHVNKVVVPPLRPLLVP